MAEENSVQLDPRKQKSRGIHFVSPGLITDLSNKLIFISRDSRILTYAPSVSNAECRQISENLNKSYYLAEWQETLGTRKRGCPRLIAVMVGAIGFEPTTSSVSGKRSPPELRA
jgi:hypothetical protein